MLPGAPEMLPSLETVTGVGAPEMLPALPEMLPASAAEDIAKVKSDAQRIDWKRFILILLFRAINCDGSLEWVCHWDVNFRASDMSTCSSVPISRLVPR